MPRTFSLEVNPSSVKLLSLAAYYDEQALLTVSPTENDYSLTIGADDDILVEIPSVAGVILITPDRVSVLTEGKSYSAYLWDVTDPGDPRVVAIGKFLAEDTIAPGVSAWPIQYLAGGGTIIEMTQAEYDALSPPAPNTTYVIVEG